MPQSNLTASLHSQNYSLMRLIEKPGERKVMQRAATCFVVAWGVLKVWVFSLNISAGLHLLVGAVREGLDQRKKLRGLDEIPGRVFLISHGR